MLAIILDAMMRSLKNYGEFIIFQGSIFRHWMSICSRVAEKMNLNVYEVNLFVQKHRFINVYEPTMLINS